MATECTAYRDTKGGLHSTPEKATLADLAGVLGRVGEEGGMTAASPSSCSTSAKRSNASFSNMTRCSPRNQPTPPRRTRNQTALQRDREGEDARRAPQGRFS